MNATNLTPVPSNERPLTNRQKQALARREQILDVALRLFAKQGFAATTTKQIAQTAGIAEGLIFRYFPTKISLLEALGDRPNTVSQTLEDIFEQSEDLRTHEVLTQIAMLWMNLTTQDQDVISMFISEGQTNPDVSRTLREIVDKAVTQLATYLTLRVKTGELRSDLSCYTTAQMFFSTLILFFINHRHSDEETTKAHAATFIPELVDGWLRGAEA